MIKEITYTGLSARPFDNSSTDGDLSIAANCINEKGCIQPVLPPGLAQTIKTEPQDTDDALSVSSMYEVLATHTCEGTTNYIIKRIKTSTLNPSNVEEQLYTLEKDKSTATLSPVSNGKATPTLAVYAKIYSVSVIGNILTALTSDGKQYILYKESKYVLLGSEPPRINLQFCLEQVCEPLYKWNEGKDATEQTPATEGAVEQIGFYKPFHNLNVHWNGTVGGQMYGKPGPYNTDKLEEEYVRCYNPVTSTTTDWFDKMFRVPYEVDGKNNLDPKTAYKYTPLDPSADKSDACMREFTQAVFGAYQKEMVERVEKKGYFNQPFLVRYAYRLYNGDYAFFSPPVLLTPSLIVPYCRMLGTKPKTDGTHESIIAFDYVKCQLRYTFDDDNLNFDLDDWENWGTIIQSIDVFISSPIYTWDTDGMIKEQVKHNDWVDDDEWYIKNTLVPIGTPIYNTFEQVKVGDDVYNVGSESKEGDKIKGSYLGAFIGFNEDNFDKDNDNEPKDSIARSQYPVVDWYVPKIPKDRSINNTTNYDYIEINRHRDVVKFPKNENFYKDIASVQNFYKIAEIEIPSSTNGFTTDLKLLKLLKKDLSNLEVFERISDDYYSKSKIVSRSQFTFNNRINLIGYKKYFPKLYIEDLMSFGGTNQFSSGNNNLRLFFDIYYYNSGRKCHYRYSQITDRGCYKSNGNDIIIPKRLFRYLFYPDPNVFRIDLRYSLSPGVNSEEVDYTNSKPLVSLKMSKSDFLNGSCFFDKYNDPPSMGDALTDDIGDCDYYEEKNKVYTSNVNNPFIFNAVNINTIGHGELYALSSTTQPLSQGQFGLYPLYAFASDGVWALETNSEGGYSAKSILSRDVIIHDKDGLATPPLQLENSIIYACDRGIVLLNGSTNQSISEVIDERFPADFVKFQSFEKLTAGLNEETLNLISFKQFINGAKYAYDYGNERVWVFNTNHSYAYVFSLKSKLWGIADCNLNAYFSAFPDSFATTRDAKIVDLTNSDATTAAGFFMTRPFALEMNDIHKTIYSVYQRGLFHNTVNTVLYGSNDLLNWYVVDSSVDHRILNIAGTPYKYFRVASRFNLSGNENILGASIEVNPKMTNKLR